MEENGIGSSFRLDVLSATNDGLNPSLILTVKKVIESQYVFNVPEGFARFALEHKLRPGLGLRAVFLTGVGHECHGLPGLLMRLRGDGHGAFELFGPSSSLAYVRALPNVCSWKNPAVLVSSNIKSQFYEDENVTIRAIIEGSDWKRDSTTGYNFPDDRAMILEQLGNLCPPIAAENHSIFNRKYFRDATVRHGSIWSRYQDPAEAFECRGVKADDFILGYICTIKGSGETILVSGYLNSFSHQVSMFLRHPMTRAGQRKNIAILCSSSGFHRGSEYLKILQEHVKTWLCILLHVVGLDLQGHSCLGFDSTAKVSSRLHGVCPYLFPLPHCWKYLKDMCPDTDSEAKDASILLESGILGPFNRAFQLQANGIRLRYIPYKSRECIESKQDLFQNQGGVNEIKHIDELRNLQTKIERSFRKDVSRHSSSEASKCNEAEGSNMSAALTLRQNLLSSKKRKSQSVQNCSDHEKPETNNRRMIFANNCSDPYVLFLGTGSAEPSKYRGPSGILIKIPFCTAEHYMLLECGEGTFGQLVRMFGYRGALDRLSKTRCIWISHRHADHMSGLVELLHRRSSRENLGHIVVMGPRACIHWISSLQGIIDFGILHLEHISKIPYSAVCQRMQQHLHASLHCTPVQHCHDAYAISILFANKFKLVYSGDTEPCQALVRDGQGADLLIHEATFDPEMTQDARKKKHSTITEAIDIATQMNAKRTILTHFSQRYPKFPKGLPDKGDGHGPSLSVAFDGFCVPWSLLDDFHEFTPYFRTILE